MNPIDRHKVSVLHFSGGKDSLATLLYLRDWWPQITVMWCNTGAAFPETLELMQSIKAIVPNFVEVRTNQPAQTHEHGWPVDVLPVWAHPRVQKLLGQNPPRQKLQPFLDCCALNIMEPTYEATRALGATLIIRGQKNADHHKPPLRSGDTLDGIEYYYPIEDWTEGDVFDFIKKSGFQIPQNYAYFNSSFDCWSCTAFLKDNIGKRTYMKERHPEWYSEVGRRLSIISKELSGDLAFLDEAQRA